mmetsp:Transcript_21627/g.31476  ORF Transcript_21627/g.31476 Transcript_21627/m.31476 type:complete len:480 (+) Transcript_21627:72-1511(+)
MDKEDNTNTFPDTTQDIDDTEGDDVFIEEGALVEVDFSDDEECPPDDDDDTIAETEEVMEENPEMEVDIPDVSFASFARHNDSVYCASLHPSRPGLAVSGGGDDTAFLWSYGSSTTDDGEENGRGVKSCIELDGHTDTVTAVGFNFDGTLVLTGGYDGLVNIWSTETGEKKHTLEGPEDIEWAVWHPKGNAVLAGSKDGTVWMWLAHTGQCVQVFAGHVGGVSCGMFSRDGKVVCSGGEDGTVRLWGPKTGACKHCFTGALGGGHSGNITCLDGNEDGDLLASGGFDGEVHLYHIPGKRLLKKLIHSEPVKVDHPSPPDEESAAMTEDNDEEDDPPTEQEEVLSVECVGFSHKDIKWLASGGIDKNLKIWDISTGSCRCICRHEDAVVALKWHESLPVVVSACLDFTVRVWDARSGVVLSSLTGHRDLVTNIDFKRVDMVRENSENGEIENEKVDAILSVSDDGTAKVFHIDVSSLLLA